MELLKKIFLTLIFIFLATSLLRNFLEYRKNLTFYEDFKNNYQDELKKNISLKTDILKSTDPHEVEKTIRNRLNLLKPNEVAVVIPNPTPTPVMVTPTPLPVYQQWFKTFFGN